MPSWAQNLNMRWEGACCTQHPHSACEDGRILPAGLSKVFFFSLFYFVLFIECDGWHPLTKLCGFQVHGPGTHHLCTVLCVRPPRLRLRPPPCAPCTSSPSHHPPPPSKKFPNHVFNNKWGLLVADDKEDNQFEGVTLFFQRKVNLYRFFQVWTPWSWIRSWISGGYIPCSHVSRQTYGAAEIAVKLVHFPRFTNGRLLDMFFPSYCKCTHFTQYHVTLGYLDC